MVLPLSVPYFHGLFINAVISFLIVAFAVLLIIRGIDKLQKTIVHIA
jgi:large-conductance mechanosensitive channel